MRILCTMPGRHGDILWSLPTARAIAESVGEPVDFMVSAKYGAVAELIGEQPYIRTCWANESWDVVESAPMSPRTPPAAPADLAVHLGYDGWPSGRNLPESIWKIADAQVPALKPIDLERPWIAVEDPIKCDLSVGFSDEWAEMKAGVTEAVFEALDRKYSFLVTQRHAHARFNNEWYWGYKAVSSFLHCARIIAGSRVFLGCLSSPWVIANALGKRTVIMEPSEPRWNPVFWRESPLNHLCRGGDGKPTFDARVVVQEVKRALEETR